MNGNPMITKEDSRDGQIVTFYSYKGGTGRTMALCNVAYLLATKIRPKKKVLMIDWDLEAPGLDKYIYNQIPKSNVKETNHKGLIDLFIKIREIQINYVDKIKSSPTSIFDHLDFEDYLSKTQFENLHLITAGIFDDTYQEKVNTFDWKSIHDKSPSFFREFAKKLSNEYDYVLIDSRTGFSDISGICTMLMPQKLVLVYTPNLQNHIGLEDIIRRSTTFRSRSPDFRPLLIFPLPSRIEASRGDLRKIWRNGDDKMQMEGYQPMFEKIFKSVYDLDECNLNKYFDEVQIQQSPNYAYGEKVAVLVEESQDRFSLTGSYEIFTQWLFGYSAPWDPTGKNLFVDEENQKIKANDLADLGSIFQKRGQLDQAIEYYSEALKIHESINDERQMAIDLSNLGSIYLEKNQLDQAIKLHLRALTIYEKYHHKLLQAVTLSYLGDIFRQKRELDQAIDYFTRALKIDESINDERQMAIDLSNLGSIYLEKNQLDQAIKYLDQSLKKVPDSTITLINKGRALFHKGKHIEAIDYYDKVLAIDPENIYALTMKGWTLDRLGKHIEAIDYYDKVLAIDPENIYVLSNKAWSLDKVGRVEEAISFYDRVLKKNPNDFVSYLNKGWALSSLNKFQEAIVEFDKAIEKDPNNALAYNNKGWALSSLNKFQEAIVEFDKAIEKDPNNALAYNNKGWALYKLGMYEEAIVEFDKAIEKDPKVPYAIANKQLVLEKMSK